jgi:hypothetical protein
MSDPFAAIAASVAGAVTSIALTTIGIEPQSIMWCAIGAGAGTAIAPGLGRAKQAVVFLCTILLCALLGTWVAQKYGGGDNIVRNLAGAFSAFFFHPFVSAAVSKIPEALDGLLRKLGLKT